MTVNKNYTDKRSPPKNDIQIEVYEKWYLIQKLLPLYLVSPTSNVSDGRQNLLSSFCAKLYSNILLTWGFSCLEDTYFVWLKVIVLVWIFPAQVQL